MTTKKVADDCNCPEAHFAKLFGWRTFAAGMFAQFSGLWLAMTNHLTGSEWVTLSLGALAIYGAKSAAETAFTGKGE
jgi:hypothetical protein